MSHPYIDTSVIVRLLTGDDPTKQARSRVLFQQVERGKIAVAAKKSKFHAIPPPGLE
jgi:predicted nucleic acid-binding protein